MSLLVSLHYAIAAALKPAARPRALQGMENQKKDQPDKNLAADQRPVPSQAEGDRKTIEEDLKEKEREQAGKRNK